jgi:hypothetical protein
MFSEFFSDANFYRFLTTIDQDIADQVRQNGCPHCRGIVPCTEISSSFMVMDTGFTVRPWIIPNICSGWQGLSAKSSIPASRHHSHPESYAKIRAIS